MNTSVAILATRLVSSGCRLACVKSVLGSKASSISLPSSIAWSASISLNGSCASAISLDVAPSALSFSALFLSKDSLACFCNLIDFSAPATPSLPIPNAPTPPIRPTAPPTRALLNAISPAPAFSSRRLAATSISEPALEKYAPSPAPAATSTARGLAAAFKPSFIDCLLTSALVAPDSNSFFAAVVAPNLATAPAPKPRYVRGSVNKAAP